MHSTVRIRFENLAAMEVNDRRPLSELIVESHIHGGLRLEFGGRLVPHLGYFGPDDVCFSQWIVELRHAAEAMRTPDGRHVFDEGEQGQPAFVFEREGEKGYFSVAESEISEGQADPDWQRISFSPADFITAHEEFRRSFTTALRTAAPMVAEQWLSRLSY